MIDFRLSLDALGQTRFAYSPLSEVASSLRVLDCPVGPALQPWQAEIGTRLQSLDLDMLRSVVPPGPYAPAFLFLSSTDPKISIDQQLTQLLDLPEEVVRRDVCELWDGRRPPMAALELMGGAMPVRHRLNDAISEYWQVAIAPYWAQMRAVLDDDVSYLARQVLEGGLYDLLSDLHPEVTLRDGVLYVDKPHLPNASYAGAELTLLPSIFVWPKLIIAHDDPGHFDVIYAARGVGRVWDSDTETDAADALAALLGRTRAAILSRLSVPLSTTALSRELGQSAGTVSEHLSVLRRSGLLTSWRSGRSVLYRRTPLASSIIAVSQPDAGRMNIA